MPQTRVAPSCSVEISPVSEFAPVESDDFVAGSPHESPHREVEMEDATSPKHELVIDTESPANLDVEEGEGSCAWAVRSPSAIYMAQAEDAITKLSHQAEGKTLHEIYETMTESERGMRMRLYHIFHGTPSHEADRAFAAVLNIVHVIMILVSATTFIVETLPEFYSPDMDFHSITFIIESTTVAYFTLDAIARVVFASMWREVFSLHTLIDFVSIVGYYIEVISSLAGADNREVGGLVVLRLVRLVRVFRVLKLSRYHRGMQLMLRVLRVSSEGLVLLLLLTLIAVVLFSTVIFYTEMIDNRFDDDRQVWVMKSGHDSEFQSIPHTFWFVVVTITTVGYGRMVPAHAVSRVVAAMIMFFGVLVLAFPNVLISASFQDEHKKLNQAKAVRKLGSMFRRVRMVVRFIRMWREFRINKKLKVYGKTTLVDSLADTQAASSHKTSMSRRTTNFFFSQADYPEYDYNDHTPGRLKREELEDWVCNGASALTMLQRLLEGFSSVASVEELAMSFAFYPHLGRRFTHAEVFEVLCHMADANFVRLFVVLREPGGDSIAVAALTKRATHVLQSYGESSRMPCLRCVEEAQDIWLKTTGKFLVNFLPLDGYRRYQSAEQKLFKRSALDFAYDYKKPDARHNNVFKGFVPLDTNPQRPAAESDDLIVDEELLTLRSEIAQNTLTLFKLKKALAAFEAQVVQKATGLDLFEGSDAQPARRQVSRHNVQKLRKTQLLNTSASSDEVFGEHRNSVEYHSSLNSPRRAAPTSPKTSEGSRRKTISFDGQE